MTFSGLTIAQARRALSENFAKQQIESAEADARILIGAALALDHTALVARENDAITTENAARIEVFAARRIGREPVARILGQKEFWSLPLAVTADVLVPRADTETLVETALDHVVVSGLREERLRVLDIGTGSGALALALLSELKQAAAVATDRSLAALAVARGNAKTLGLAARCAFVAGNYADAVAGPFDLIVSNPPYIAHGEIAALDADVRDYDPHLALDGGPDGLAAYRAILADAPRLLAAGGRLVLELGAGQDAAVTALGETADLRRRGLRADLAGIPRALTFSLPN